MKEKNNKRFGEGNITYEQAHNNNRTAEDCTATQSETHRPSEQEGAYA
jgi:hypothetical protein